MQVKNMFPCNAVTQRAGKESIFGPLCLRSARKDAQDLLVPKTALWGVLRVAQP